MTRAVSLLTASLLLLACGSPPPPALPPPEPKISEDLPTWCDGGDKPCRPTRDFAARLCHASFPGTTLYLFQKSSPWQRRWVKINGLDGRNGEGGPSGGALQHAEEVLLMAYEEPPIEASGKASKSKKPDADIVVLRWDGTCASVKSSDAVTFQPAAQKHARVNYEKLDLSIQRSLLRDTEIDKGITERKSACEGGASENCEKADQTLSNLIVTKVRRGTKLSMPDQRP